MDLEFVTSRELIDELMRRETFSGVVIDANLENGRGIRVELHHPTNMTALTAALTRIRVIPKIGACQA